MPDRKYTTGRSPSCDIVLADESVSRVHEDLTFLVDGKLLVTDCRSTQGASLMHHGCDVRAIKQELVSPLDTLCFGTVSMPVKDLLQAIHLKHWLDRVLSADRRNLSKPVAGNICLSAPVFCATFRPN